MDPEVKRLDTEEQYREARRALFAMGFSEVGEVCVGGYMSSIFVAPDGYTCRLLFDAKAQAPS